MPGKSTEIRPFGPDAIDAAAYPDLENFYADLAAAYRAEIASLADAGCRYLQLDDTNLAYLCDDTQRENARKRGMDPDELPRLYARLINESIRDRPDDMVVGVHLCRGNYRSSWAAEGGYEPVAEVLFNELEIDSYFTHGDPAAFEGDRRKQNDLEDRGYRVRRITDVMADERPGDVQRVIRRLVDG